MSEGTNESGIPLSRKEEKKAQYLEGRANGEKPYFNEFAAVQEHFASLSDIYGKQIDRHNVQHLIGKGTKTDHPTSWKITLNPVHAQKEKVAVFDWDDTLEPYTERKNKFYQEFAISITNSPEKQEKIITACKMLNKAARVLPVNGVHPERYSPFLELICINLLARADQSTLFSIETKEDAQEYIRQHVLPNLDGKVAEKIEQKEDGSIKHYFIENQNQAISINFSQKPDHVSEAIWNSYKTHMTESNIPEEEFKNFDVPENVHFIVMSYGQIDFQMEKITKSLKAIKERGERLPDEIIIVTRGRKIEIIKLLKKLGLPLSIYDDSLRQVESLAQEHDEQITAYHAKREGAQRSKEESDTVPSVTIGKTHLSELIK